MAPTIQLFSCSGRRCADRSMPAGRSIIKVTKAEKYGIKVSDYFV
jgi:hypothetical protein